MPVFNCSRCAPLSCFFFFNDTATTEIYTLSLHDALPICQHAIRSRSCSPVGRASTAVASTVNGPSRGSSPRPRSEEHTSELQSRLHLVCRLLLEKKKKPRAYDRLDAWDILLKPATPRPAI